MEFLSHEYAYHSKYKDGLFAFLKKRYHVQHDDWPCHERNRDIILFHSLLVHQMKNSPNWESEEQKTIVLRKAMIECYLSIVGRPYFQVYPSILEMANKVDVKAINLRDIKLPNECKVSLDFYEDNQFINRGSGRVIELSFPLIFGSSRLLNCICLINDNSDEILISSLEYDPCAGNKAADYSYFFCGDVALQLETVKAGAGYFENRGEEILKTLFAVTLLAKNPEFCVRDVLSRDKMKYATTESEEIRKRIEERAKRRGKFGWKIGEAFESIPHIRRPHFAIRWTGKGGRYRACDQ